MSLNVTRTETPDTSAQILVVEDEVLLRAMLSEVLRDAGYSVIEASNGDEAMVILSEMSPDLMVTDVRMPGSIDGIQLTALIRATNVKLPIIITSAHLVHVADPANGRTHFLPKPYDFDAVTELIGHELKQH